ncbi:fumarylacetoacetate hydrolase family protein [Streptomyces yaanensis]|uniref:Fumarylacetoacetate hydrolase family protein n=1 Tax=Streptomyces yaanensis TaxID=1142239 RepID=A0ABV7SP14_9ACTN|nr:fumarylacetoacetate hydrolase family protein [Streptomyces sp. CGMCC 4.7035]WNC00396.1 fumarylacetoacetate hydrolase family protein [Streptomyces sp. CGMCC 4.7035]
MKLATIRTGTGTAAVRIDETEAVETGHPDVGALLAEDGWRELAATADGARHALDGLDYAPVVPRPQKIFCVGLNYRSHILEMGRELPQYPTLFAKFPAVLIGAYDDIVLPAASQAMDWEGEMAVVIGARARNVTEEQADGHIAGYAVLNDVTARDWQYRTKEWLQGKNFEATTPFGPVLVTSDEAGSGSRTLTTEVDGETKQQADTGDLVFEAAALVSYLSTIITLEPGDVIATGTPGGVGQARAPKEYLGDGTVLTTRIEGLGECRNHCVQEKPHDA